MVNHSIPDIILAGFVQSLNILHFLIAHLAHPNIDVILQAHSSLVIDHDHFSIGVGLSHWRQLWDVVRILHCLHITQKDLSSRVVNRDDACLQSASDRYVHQVDQSLAQRKIPDACFESLDMNPQAICEYLHETKQTQKRQTRCTTPRSLPSDGRAGFSESLESTKE